ncbi:MAG: hypothetical protein PHI98_13665 [Eubacteriales bacterium]|nr:hypothetical protein [Eubacteriales bacterium]
MKYRISRLLICLILVSTVSAASADLYFIEKGGPTLHRDPLCESWAILQSSPETVLFNTFEELYAAPEGYLPCQKCCTLYPSMEAADSLVYYYNPDGGKLLHVDPNCASVSKAYLPLKGTVGADDSASLSKFGFCPVCAHSQTATASLGALSYFDTLEQKAALLPGVWTLPSSRALSEQRVYDIAKAYVENQPKMMKRFSNGLFTVGVMHYDVGSQAHPTEAYKALITTVLAAPVAILSLDALTGEVYSALLLDAQ